MGQNEPQPCQPAVIACPHCGFALDLSPPEMPGPTEALAAGPHGYRFNRKLRECYVHLSGRQDGRPLPSQLAKLMANLSAELRPQKGQIGSVLRGYRQMKHVAETLRTLREELKDTSHDRELFGLSLWLRSPDRDQKTNYAISLIASSTHFYVWNDSSRINLHQVSIDPYSPYLESRAMFYGNAIFRNLPRRDPFTHWRSGVAVPIRQIERIDHTPGGYFRGVTVGCICLTSTAHITPSEASSASAVSLIMALTPDERFELAGKLEVFARQLLGI
jgi:hypothetical protein